MNEIKVSNKIKIHKIYAGIYDSINIIIIIAVVLICVLPFLHIASLSLSSNSAIIAQKVTIFPVDIDLQSYISVFRDKSMIRSMAFTVSMTVVFTAISMFMTICTAYPLTKKWLRGRNFFLFMIVFTMFFSGGIIPDYILVKNLKLLNTMWALVLPGMISVFNMIVLKTFLSEIPDSLVESAYMDGANEFTILINIILPLSIPVLATLSLLYAVWRWNYFQDALMYITKAVLYPLQLKLYQIIFLYQATDIMVNEGAGSSTTLLPESLRAASIMFGTVPILCVYPRLQRYFVKGLTLGSTKG